LKLKIDENLPVDCAVILRDAGFEADTYLMSASKERTTQ
jgi:hypothetical protein